MSECIAPTTCERHGECRTLTPCKVATMSDIHIHVPRVKPDPKGIAAARRIAQYEIGDPTWAHVIIDAYLNPEAALDELKQELERDDE